MVSMINPTPKGLQMCYNKSWSQTVIFKFDKIKGSLCYYIIILTFSLYWGFAFSVSLRQCPLELMKQRKLQAMRLLLWALREGYLTCSEVAKSVNIATIQNVTLLIQNLAQPIIINIVIPIIKKSAIPITIRFVIKCTKMCATLCTIPSVIQPMEKSVIPTTKKFVIVMDMDMAMIITMDTNDHTITTDTDMEDMDIMHPNVIKCHMKYVIAIQRSIAQNIREKYVISIQIKSVNKFRRKNVINTPKNIVKSTQFINAMKFHTKFVIKLSPNVAAVIVGDADIIKNNYIENVAFLVNDKSKYVIMISIVSCNENPK